MKRSPSLRALSSEHHAGLVLARRIDLVHAPDEVPALWIHVTQQFESQLEPHFLTEETLLLPPLARAGETALAKRTLNEHDELRALVHGEKKDRETLKLFANLLRSHIRFEERELFEAAQRIDGFSTEGQGTPGK